MELSVTEAENGGPNPLAKMSAVEDAIAELGQRARDLDQGLSHLTTVIGQTQTMVSALSRRIEKVNEQVDTLSARQSELADTIAVGFARLHDRIGGGDGDDGTGGGRLN